MNVFVENEVNIWKKKRRQALKRELSAYKLVLFFLPFNSRQSFLLGSGNLRLSRQYKFTITILREATTCICSTLEEEASGSSKKLEPIY